MLHFDIPPIKVDQRVLQREKFASYSSRRRKSLAWLLLLLYFTSVFRAASSCWTSTKLSKPVFRKWFKASFARLGSSFVIASTSIFWWGTHLTMDLVSCKSFKMMANSRDDFLSCLPDGCSFKRQSNKDFASVTVHCWKRPPILHSPFMTIMCGEREFRHCASWMSCCVAAIAMIWSQSTSLTPWSMACVSPPKVLRTFLRSLEDLHVMGVAFTIWPCSVNFSAVKTIHAPCVASHGRPSSSIWSLPFTLIPPASLQTMKHMSWGSNFHIMRGRFAVDLRKFTNLVTVKRSEMVAVGRRLAIMEAIPHASGRVSLPTQLMRKTRERSCWNSSCDSFWSFCFLQSLWSMMGWICSMMYLDWSIKILSLRTWMRLPAYSASSSSHLPKTKRVVSLERSSS